jgi:hypothetical protein
MIPKAGYRFSELLQPWQGPSERQKRHQGAG